MFNSRSIVRNKLFEGDVIDFHKYISDKELSEQIKFELREAEQSLTALRNALLKANPTRVELAFREYAKESAAIYDRISSLLQQYNMIKKAE